MSEQSERRTAGGCMCGAVRFEAAGEPIIVTHCHCNSCRHHTGAPLVTLVSFDAGQVTFTRESEQRGQSLIEFHIGTLDDANALPPSVHVFHGERLAWFDTADRLPRYETNRHGKQPYRHAPANDLGAG